jgi:vacuolar-type H+-ATPase subunit I/STV1
MLNLYNKLKHKSYREALVALSYAWMYLGFINLVFGVSYSTVGQWFSTTGAVYLWIPIAGIGYGTGNNGIYPMLPVSPLIFTLLTFIVPFALMAISSAKGGMDGIVIFFENAIGTISHTVSYARIFALNTVHIILSGLFISLNSTIIIPFPELSVFGIEIIPPEVWTETDLGLALVPAYLPVVGAVLGSIIVGMLEGLLAFMHALRLHFVEWFSKFYHAGGVAFAPYHVSRLHTTSIVSVPLQQSYAVS